MGDSESGSSPNTGFGHVILDDDGHIVPVHSTRRSQRHKTVPAGTGNATPEPKPVRRRKEEGEVPDRRDAVSKLSRRSSSKPLKLGTPISPQDAVLNDKLCRIAAATILDSISRQYHDGKGIQRYRDWQNAMMDNAMVLVLGGILTYDKLIEQVKGMEDVIERHGGGDMTEFDDQDRLKAWLNGDNEVVN